MATDQMTTVTEQQFAGEFRKGLLIVLEEIFEHVHGYLLHKETSLFETLATVSAEEASRPISSQCASIAAQVNHTLFYIDVLLEFVSTGQDVKSDWDGSWQVGPVSDEEWQELIERLRTAYAQVQELARSFDQWDANHIGGSFALVGHCAYYLGEIRQGLGVLRG
ncbi:hypothetical protein BH24CHL4_BH24CHL4_21870 [soil metagenome]